MDRYHNALQERLKYRKNRKVLLIGDEFFVKHILGILRECDVEVELANPSDKNKREYFILVCAVSGHKEYYEMLIGLGYVYENDFSMMNIGGYTRPITHIDPLLSYARERPYDELGEGSFTIMVLGDSISDLNKGGMTVWPVYLNELCEMRGIESKILLGAVSGYSSSQCLLKLIRDIYVVKPKLVICCSGATDIGISHGNGSVLKGYPLTNKYQYRMWNTILSIPDVIPDSLDMRNIHDLSIGFEENIEDSEIWIRNMRNMNAICSVAGVPFMCILEPLLGCGSVIEKSFWKFMKDAGFTKAFFQEQRNFVKQIREAELDFVYDFSSIMEDVPEAYMDPIHFTSYGHQVLAKKIFEKVKLLII